MKKFIIFLLIMFLAVPAYARVVTGDGTKTITTAGSAVALTATSTKVTTLTVCGDRGNTGKIVVGDTPVNTSGAMEGIVLGASECASIWVQNASNAFDVSEVKVDSTVNAEEASYFWMREEN